MIRIVGLGPSVPEAMSVAARDALRAATCLILRTERHPSVAFLRDEGVPYTPCDDLYETLPDFDAVYSAIVERVLQAASSGDVTYAVPGHPCLAEDTVRRLVGAARDHDHELVIVGSESFVEPTLAAARLIGPEPLLLVDALTLSGVAIPAACTNHLATTDAAMLIYQVHDAAAAAAVKLALLETRPDDHEILVIRAAGVPGHEEVEAMPLHLLDRARTDHLTSVYVPPLPAERRTRTFPDLVEVMARLRGEGGCPWDREQDHRTLRKWLIEECYEAIEAIDNDDLGGLCEELGDVLLQIVFHAQVATEEGAFTIADVIGEIVTKLVRRHPHVFGDGNADNPEAVVRNWEAIKKAEKGDREAESALDGVPIALPALTRANEISAKAARVGFDWPDALSVLDKIAEETAEVRHALATGDRTHVAHEIGDLLFAIVNLARWAGVDPEEALRDMLRRFARRFRDVEAQAAAMGRPLGDMTIGEMDELWERAKSVE